MDVQAIDGQIKVPRVIANLEPTDRVQYMTPDSVSGDQNLYVKQYRSEIRLALGGVDDIDIGTALLLMKSKVCTDVLQLQQRKKQKHYLHMVCATVRNDDSARRR